MSAAGELATFTATSKRPPKLPAYRHERLRESFDPVIAALRESLSKVLMQSAISDPDRAAEVRHQRRDRRRSVAVQHARSSSWRRAPTCRRKSCGAGSRRSSRSARRKRSATWCGCSCRACRCMPVPVAPRQIPVSRGLRVLRARSDRRAVGAAQGLRRHRDARRRRVPGAGAGVLGDSRLSRG